MLVGYARISTSEQTLDPQLDQLKAVGCERIFTDVISGSKSDRPGLDDAMHFLRPGDTLVVTRLDRLGRSLKDLIKQTGDMSSKGIEFKSLAEAIDTSSASGKLLFHVMGALSEIERTLIVDRTKSGLAAARARGRVGGRPPKDPSKLKAAISLYQAREMTIKEIKKATGVSASTLYRALSKIKDNQS